MNQQESELIDTVTAHLSMLREQLRGELTEREEFLLNYIERLEAKTEALEARVSELERDRIHKLIALESRKLGISEEEFIRNIAGYIKEKVR
ncbi:MAG: hypothetical protein QXJ17_04520 [Nitrososphaeria archaeon]